MKNLIILTLLVLLIVGIGDPSIADDGAGGFDSVADGSGGAEGSDPGK